MFEKSLPSSYSPLGSAQERWKRVQERRKYIQTGTWNYNWREPQFKFR